MERTTELFLLGLLFHFGLVHHGRISCIQPPPEVDMNNNSTRLNISDWPDDNWYKDILQKRVKEDMEKNSSKAENIENKKKGIVDLKNKENESYNSNVSTITNRLKATVSPKFDGRQRAEVDPAHESETIKTQNGKHKLYNRTSNEGYQNDQFEYSLKTDIKNETETRKKDELLRSTPDCDKSTCSTATPRERCYGNSCTFVVMFASSLYWNHSVNKF